MFALAELKAPASVSGNFIHAGNEFDALASIGKVLGLATTKALIVDPYMDEKVLTDFAVLMEPSVGVHLLADISTVKPSLAPSVARWRNQYTKDRKLMAKVSPARMLHDRLIIIDDSQVWSLTQSLNAFAKRSPASIIKVDSETAKLKAEAYQLIWNSSADL